MCFEKFWRGPVGSCIHLLQVSCLLIHLQSFFLGGLNNVLDVWGGGGL